MKKKQFMSKLAALTMAAAMGITALPATAVFAADVVSVEPSNGTVTSPYVKNGDTTSDNFLLKTALGNAITTVENAGGIASDIDNATLQKKINDAFKSAHADYEIAITSKSLTPLALDDDGYLTQPTLTITAETATTTAGAAEARANVTFTINVDSLAPADRVAAAKLIVDAHYNDNESGVAVWNNDDNTITVKNKINAIITKYDDVDHSGATKHLVGVITTDTTPAAGTTGHTSFATTVSSANVTKADTADGSVAASATFTATRLDADAAGNKSTVTGTASSTFTGTIKKANQSSDDDAYETKIENALAAVNWTDDDFDESGSTPALSSSGVKKFVDAINGVDAKSGAAYTVSGTTYSLSNPATVSVQRLKNAEHGKAGSARLNFSLQRNATSPSSFVVKVNVTHGSATVKTEISDAITEAVTNLTTNKRLLQPKGNVAATKAEVTAAIKTAIDSTLANTLGTSTTIASEIASYDVVIPDDTESSTNGLQAGYQASTSSSAGYVKFYVAVKTGNKSAEDPTKDEVWYFGNNDERTAATAADNCYDISALPTLSENAATAITLPATTSYVDVTKKLEIKPTFTPDKANTYVIRWTSSNSAFKFDKANLAASYANATNTHPTYVTSDAETGYTADSNAKLVAPATAQVGDSTTVTAELIDDDGNVVSKATTLVTVSTAEFDDVKNSSAYYYNAVYKLAADKVIYKNGAYTKTAVVSGKGDNKFDPASDVTRAEFISFLYRMAQWNGVTREATSDDATNYGDKFGVVQYNALSANTDQHGLYPVFNDSAASSKFVDVDSKAYYAKAVDWAVANNITSGTDATHFSPNNKITRAEAVSFLQRMIAAGQTYNTKAGFVDVTDGAYYANAVNWAYSNGVTAGKDDTHFAPADTTSRAEAVTFIARAFGYVPALK